MCHRLKEALTDILSACYFSKNILDITKGYKINVNIMTGENVANRTSFIGQFVYPVGGEGMG